MAMYPSVSQPMSVTRAGAHTLVSIIAVAWWEISWKFLMQTSMLQKMSVRMGLAKMFSLSLLKPKFTWRRPKHLSTLASVTVKS